MTGSLDPLSLDETRATRIIVVQIAMMVLATAAVILIVIFKILRGIPWGSDHMLTIAALVRE